jgi:excisionase family DNA binding protein
MASSAPPTEPILLTLSDVAAALGVHLSTVKRLVSAGELPTRKLGHLTRVRYDELKAFADRLPAA